MVFEPGALCSRLFCVSGDFALAFGVFGRLGRFRYPGQRSTGTSSCLWAIWNTLSEWRICYFCRIIYKRMLDHKYKVFYQLCLTPSTTAAADILGLTQPAVSKNIRELEKELGVTLFGRTRNGMMLTEAGQELKRTLEPWVGQERLLKHRLNQWRGVDQGELKIGGSTTLTQYVLPEVLAGFAREWPDISLSLFNGNTQQIEEMVLNKSLHIAFIEGNKGRNDLHYEPFLTDELVLVGSASGAWPERMRKADLPSGRFVFRERGSGTYHVIRKKLEKEGIGIQQLASKVRLGSTEAIKRYVACSEALAFLSRYSIRQELEQKRLKVIEVDDLRIERMFYSIHLQGEIDPYAAKFMDFASRFLP